MRRMICLISILLIICPVAARAAANEESMAGYVDFGQLKIFDELEANVEVYIKRPILKMIMEIAKHEEPELAQVLSKIDLIQVHVFAIKDRETKEIVKRTDRIASRIEKNDWEKMARIRESDEQVYIYVKTEKDHIAGLFIMVIEPGDEAVFINMVGDVDPSQIGRIGSTLNIGPLEDINLEKKK